MLASRMASVWAAQREYLLEFMIAFVIRTLTEIGFNEKIADGIQTDGERRRKTIHQVVTMTPEKIRFLG